MSTPLELDATGQAQLVASKQISATELIDLAIAAVGKVNPQLNAVIHPRFERARDEAKKGRSGAFAGVPIVVKDLNCQIKGEPYHLGTRFLKNRKFVATEDSYLYERLCRAGFITIGRTNVPEFGSTITTEPLAYGPARNPWNTDHSTGGSSGGSAATVAAGCVAVAHANDGGGSIRIPASECGLVGLKPSKGRVSLGPALGESWIGGVVEGCVTRSVRDTAAVMDAISGYEPGDPNTPPPPARAYVSEVGAPVGKLRVGLLSGALLPGGLDHPEARASVAATGKLLESLGHHVEVTHPIALNDADFGDMFLAIVIAHIANDVAALEKQFGVSLSTDDIEPGNHLMAQFGNVTNVVAYLTAVGWMQAWTRKVVSWWLPRDGSQGFDVLVTPTLAGPPPKIGALSGDDSTDRIREIMQYTAQFNMTGQPAISLPLHMSADGLPMGVQFVGAPYREDLLLRLAAQLETAAPWSQRRPAVHA
ncbi:MAG: amidase [Actinobacteria bacterium]|nr:amidase [Actinomycetota bacterium]